MSLHITAGGDIGERERELTTRMKLAAGMSRFQVFWKRRISLRATVPGLKRCRFLWVCGVEALKQTNNERNKYKKSEDIPRLHIITIMNYLHQFNLKQQTNLTEKKKKDNDNKPHLMEHFPVLFLSLNLGTYSVKTRNR